MVEIVNFPIQKLKVVNVVHYLEEVVFRIKQLARLRQVILVSVRQRREKSRSRTIHRGVTGPAVVAICTTTQIPPPQHPVHPPHPVSVYLHQNAQKSMEMNQTLQSVSVVPKDVLLLVRIAINLLVLVERYHIVIKKMVLSKIQLRVGAVQQIVLLNLIAINQLILVELYQIAIKKMVLQPTVLPVSVDQLNVLLIPASIAINC